MTRHYAILHYITLHYIIYITLHYITLHYITLLYITLHYTTLQYFTLHYIHTYIYIYIMRMMGVSRFMTDGRASRKNKSRWSRSWSPVGWRGQAGQDLCQASRFEIQRILRSESTFAPGALGTRLRDGLEMPGDSNLKSASNASNTAMYGIYRYITCASTTISNKLALQCIACILTASHKHP